jgi:predicted DNA-binding transcriptional regulator AlpA
MSVHLPVGDAGDGRRYVDIKKFCVLFGFSRSGVYRLVKAGVLTRLKLGGRSRFIVAEGESYMRSLPTDRRR